MRVFLFLLSIGLISQIAGAQSLSPSIDGNSIPDPELKDYQSANRSPGFSETYDIVDANGVPERTPSTL